MVVQELYGGQDGHSVDLMARLSNAQSDLSGAQLPFLPRQRGLGLNFGFLFFFSLVQSQIAVGALQRMRQVP